MSRLIHSEIVKLVSTTWFKITAAALLLISPLSAVINVFKVSGGQPIGSTDHIHHVLSCSAFTSMGMLAVGIAMMAGEYRHNTAIPTYLVTPRRARVLTAKLVTAAALGFILGAAAFGLALASAVVALHTKGIDHLAGDTAQMWIGAAFVTAAFAALGVALGALTRNVVTAIVAALVWVQLVEQALLTSLVPSVGKWMPTGANIAVTRTSTDLGELLDPKLAALVLTGWTIIVVLAAGSFVIDRDV